MMQNNVLIALTGGIGSGKSTALEIVNKLGYKSFNADLIYKQLLNNEEFVVKISNAFNIDPVNENGKLFIDKPKLSNIVFNDKTKLEKLDGITHPAIMSEMIKQAKSFDNMVFCEVPLLYEGGFDSLFDFIFVISRNNSQRIDATAKRDGKTCEQVKKIIENQFDYTKIIPNEHTFIIENNGLVEDLTEKIKVAIQKIKK